MNLLLLSWSYIKTKPLNTILNILLLSLGIAIITVLLLLSKQVEESLTQNSKGVDLVVGAKGSPLQIILSSVFHIDYPTGNISLTEAKNLSRNRLVRNTIPMALGDSYQGTRIVGTNYEYLDLYRAEITEGKRWDKVMEVTAGALAAKKLGLKIDNTFSSSHGLADDGINVHDETPFRVVGILAPTGSVVDNLLFTSVESIWQVHASHGDATPNDSSHLENSYEETHAQTYDSIATTGLPVGDADEEITSLIVQYRSPMAAVQLPRYINQRTNMQAASPPFETARLFSLVGVGIDLLQAFAYVIIIIAGLSIFIALYNALKERKYDLAVMRSLGASKAKLFAHVMLEGLIITFLGSLLGLFLGHLTVGMLGEFFTSADQIGFAPFRVLTEEYLVLIGSLAVGVIAATIPAINAYRTNISSILSQR